VFLGVDGIDATGGISTHDEVEAQTDHCLMQTAERVVVLADMSKVGNRAFTRIAPIEEVAMLITDSAASPADLDRLRTAGVEVITV
jgi:DeoR family transcriptional regulator, aga operon transcriptional repressor